MDELDHDLIAELRRDGRAAISDLAARLRVSRATVRNRMERLIAAGDIAGFIVLTRADLSEAPVRALMMIGIEGRGGDRIMARLTGMPAVMAVHSTNGKWDLIVELSTESLIELDEIIRRIRNMEGVMTSETNLLLSTRRAAARRAWS
ncbi:MULTISPECIES: Lrp/AsnC family transcriptional regulator [unclassified Paracoccus (in: a-proteobacteria)]|uniref:Lrp/AsnC family transcriptional regulator n=1 Tax=unclassified Paracoccus (in: a-proteobacteria) TaxID=2688777 RepID=UPI0012B340C6|nr:MULTISPECIES: Lrp/AsnC family transcriptional regulator [unclassified Paracoccus (in: a-proteobacteria)]UXU73634.1 Lrp/AsnC family transcriptional regulator [Paracoccus sp. SMMA_5]UXU79522.1 Lrp/AsnC family transcriptional regulator [Paracoccus sp. SMMA_5_TC]